jgi:capsular polysaccharide biosynthesis protein
MTRKKIIGIVATLVVVVLLTKLGLDIFFPKYTAESHVIIKP